MEDVLVEPSERDLDALGDWWGRLASAVPADARGLWFGITDLLQGGAVRTLYVAGCPTFDPSDANGEWATDYCWWPTDRYVTLADFAVLPDEPKQAVLAYAAALVRSLDLAQAAEVEGAAVGFDDGDLVLV